jgi:uncharacterized protein YjbJ (UPF0337 family)
MRAFEPNELLPGLGYRSRVGHHLEGHNFPAGGAPDARAHKPLLRLFRAKEYFVAKKVPLCVRPILERSVGRRVLPRARGDVAMDKDRLEGSAEQAKGKAKEAAGKALGDQKMKTEGKADQVKGKVQNAVGGLKDAIKGE